MQGKLRLRWLAAVALLSAAPGPNSFEDTRPVEDRLDVLQVDRRLLAVNGATGGVIEAALELDEQVLEKGSQGLVGFAVTNVRLLGANSRSGSWQELRYRIREREAVPRRYQLGERVVVVPLATRLAALGSKSSGWAELPLGVNEVITRLAGESNVALVLTQRRAIGFPSEERAFSEIPLGTDESVQGVSLEASSVTITTERRVLLFRAGASGWFEQIRADLP